MSPAVDYDALAKQYGAVSSSKPASVDYDALAKQYGSTSNSVQNNFESGIFNAANGGGVSQGNISPPQTLGQQLIGKLRLAATKGPEVVGQIGGGLLGTPGGLPGAVAGSAIGAAGGSATEQLLRRLFPSLDAYARNGGASPLPANSMDAASKVGTAGAIGAGSELLGQGIGAVTPALSGVLKSSAARSMEKVLNPTTAENKAITKNIVPQLLQRGTKAWTREGLEKVATENVQKAGQALDAAYDKLKGVTVFRGGNPEKNGTFFTESKDYASKYLAGDNKLLQKTIHPQSPLDLHNPAQAKIVADALGASPGKVAEGVAAIPEGAAARLRGQGYDWVKAPNNLGDNSGDVWISLRHGGEPLSEDSASTVAKQTILDAMEKSKDAFKVSGVPINDEAIARIDGLKNVINRFGDQISPKDLRATRQIWDEAVNRAGGFQKDLAAGSQIDAQKMAADSIRNTLNSDFPDIGKLNAETNFWLNVQKVIGDTNLRKTGQAGALDVLAATGGATAGIAHGGVGVHGGLEGALGMAAMMGVRKAVTSTAWRTTSAAVKNQLADALANGSLVKAMAVSSKIVSGAAGQAAVD